MPATHPLALRPSFMQCPTTRFITWYSMWHRVPSSALTSSFGKFWMEFVFIFGFSSSTRISLGCAASIVTTTRTSANTLTAIENSALEARHIERSLLWGVEKSSKCNCRREKQFPIKGLRRGNDNQSGVFLEFFFYCVASCEVFRFNTP